jgi:hypothetical protein
MKSFMVTLPNGFAFEGKWYWDAQLRTLNGDDEAAIRGFSPGLLPVERITMLLGRSLVKLGPKTKIDVNAIRALSVGDRDALLLHLRRLTYGDKIHSVLACPQAGCGEKMDLELTVGDILVPANQHAKEVYEMELNEQDSAYKIEFRLPTGADQEAVARMGISNPDSASMRLLQLCIRKMKKDGHKIESENNLPVTVAEAISKRISELDPQAVILLKMPCPACKQEFVADFDIGDFFFRELTVHSQQVFREVHLLAWHYHWNERDILHMTRSRRQLYLNQLADALNSGKS